MALTPEELRKRIPQWSLESDGQLLQYMVQISKNLEDKCKQTQNNLNRLLLEVDESNIRFANASNNFNGVQQVKFVENRVKDDDESFYSVREEEEEKGEKLPHNEIFQMAVEKSITNMYKCFEKVTVQLDSDSDSDDDDDEEAASRNTVLRAVQKYPYISRPLPHIIGSQEWRDKWHAGLIDSEEESDTETKEQYSDSSDSDGMFPSQTNSNHTPSESEGSVWGVHSDPRRRRAPSIDPSVSGDDTMSIQSTSSAARPPGMRPLISQHKIPVLPVQSFKPPSLFPDQPPDDSFSISSRSQAPNLFEESDEDESTPTHNPIMQTMKAQPSYFRGKQPETKTVNLFADEPPPPGSHEPTPTPSASSSQQRKPINLFIESDDENDSFNNNLSANTNNIYQTEPPELPTPAKKTVNLFGEEDDQQVAPNLSSSDNKRSVRNVLDEVNNNPTELEDDDLFIPVQRSINGGTEGKGVRRITNLFDDEPPVDDFDEIFKPKTIERKIPGGKFVLPAVSKTIIDKKGVPEQKPITKNANLFDNESDDLENILPSDIPESTPTSVEAAPKKSINLFDDDDDDDQSDIFATNVLGKKGHEVEVQSSVLSKKPNVNLFDAEDDVSLQPSTLAVVQNSLSDMKNSSKTVTTSQPASSCESNYHEGNGISKPTERDANHLSIRTEILKKKSIFDSDSNEDDEDDFLFGSNTRTTNTTTKKEPEPLPRKLEAISQNVVPDLVKSSVQDGSIIVDDFREEPPVCENRSKVRNPFDDNVSVGKPKIPDEPPEDFTDDQQHYPDLSNDIDYFLTTNKICESSEKGIVPKLSSNKTESNKIDEKTTTLANTPVKELESQLISPECDLNNTQGEATQNTASNTDKIAVNDVLVSSQVIASKDYTSETNSALSFSSVGLFDDVPPPDDEFDEPRLSLAIDNAEDGLFNGRSSLSSNSTAGSNANRYFFMDDDGPPPDDATAAAEARLGLDEVDDLHAVSKSQAPPPNSISVIIQERNKNVSTYEDIREKPKITKLSAKVNINVNALLPGARRPQPNMMDRQESKSAPDSIVPTVASSTNKDVDGNISKMQPEPEVGTAKLTGLNKGRARIQVKRKPPSRQTIRASLENIVATNTNQIVASSETNSEPQKEESSKEVRVVVGSEVKTQHVEVTAAHLTVNQLLSNELAQKLAQPIHLEDKDDEDDWLGGKNNFKSASPTTDATVPKKSALSAVKPLPKIPPASTDKSSTKLFSDDESEEDDLFGKNSNSVLQKPSVLPTNPVVATKHEKLPPSKPPAMAKTKSIFDDTDDDDDDLFSNPKSIAHSIPVPASLETSRKVTSKIANKNKSIFGSDAESDGEDIFGGSKKKASRSGSKFSSLPAMATEKEAANPIAPTKSLFGDDEDDDDLFGSKKKLIPKPTSSQTAGTRKMDKSNTKSVVSATDDPLADLLGS